MGLAEAAIHRWAPILEAVSLISAKSGVFRVVLDGEVLFDRHAIGRHAEPGEVEARIQERVGPPLDWR